MNNIENILQVSKDFDTYAKGYLDYMSGLLGRLDVAALRKFVNELEDARKNHNTVFVIGNGGSASTASHMANDFAIGSCSRDGDNPYRILSLADNISKITAISNDRGYERVFSDQLKVHYRPGDKLIAISASGNSANVIAAAKWMKKQGAVVIGFVGFDGGELKALCDIFIHVVTPKGEYGPVEDAHIVMDHLVYTWLRHMHNKMPV